MDRVQRGRDFAAPRLGSLKLQDQSEREEALLGPYFN